MDTSENCKTGSCYWAFRFEILGIILVLIATFLTIASRDSAGIVMLFLVGLALCIHKHFARGLFCCHHSHDASEVECCNPSSAEQSEGTKAPRTSKAVKKD